MLLCLGTTYIPIHANSLRQYLDPKVEGCQSVTKVLARQMSWVAGPLG